MRVWVLALALIACGPKELAPIVSSSKWVQVPAERDPYAQYRPAENACAPTGYKEEDLGGELTLGINAQDCAYLTVEQPALVEVEQGDLIHLRIWHFRLEALQAATATMALTIDGTLLFSREIPIPSESELISPKFPAEFSTKPGAPVVFHVRNHGSNSYNLIELSRGGEE